MLLLKKARAAHFHFSKFPGFVLTVCSTSALTCAFIAISVVGL